jgi:hypothetical protein
MLQPDADSNALAAELKALVARELGSPLQPREIRVLSDLP